MTSVGCARPVPSTSAHDFVAYSIRIAANWTDTSDYAHWEGLIVELTAPTAYGFAPTKMQFLGDLGPVHTVYGPTATAHSIAAQHASTIAHDLAVPEAVASGIGDCTLAGDPAAVFGYATPNELGYRLYVVHKDFLFEIRFFGVGGVGDQARHDALRMMASIVWGNW